MPGTDRVDQLMAYEDGSLGAEDTLRLFSDLVRTGLAWKLQGHYGRAAALLIDAGYIDRDGALDAELLDTVGG